MPSPTSCVCLTSADGAPDHPHKSGPDAIPADRLLDMPCSLHDHRPQQHRALDRKSVPLYSDLLLHDLGALGDGIGQADAARRDENRAAMGPACPVVIPPRRRAKTVNEAIRQHDGEAIPARDRYVKLQRYQQQQLLDFLNSI